MDTALAILPLEPLAGTRCQIALRGYLCFAESCESHPIALTKRSIGFSLSIAVTEKQGVNENQRRSESEAMSDKAYIGNFSEISKVPQA